MQLSFYYNKYAVVALAKEIRYASYGISGLSVISNLGYTPLLTYAIAGLLWAVLQSIAFLIESVRFNLDPENDHE